jgi:hypothetical protein
MEIEGITRQVGAIADDIEKHLNDPNYIAKRTAQIGRLMAEIRYLALEIRTGKDTGE